MADELERGGARGVEREGRSETGETRETGETDREVDPEHEAVEFNLGLEDKLHEAWR